MTKNRRKKYQEANRTEEGVNLGPVEKHERPVTVKNETAEKARGAVKLEDFPQLSACTGTHNGAPWPRNNSSKWSGGNSWLSVVTKGSPRNSREAFPSLPGSEFGRNLKIEKNSDKSQQPIIKKENAVVEKATVKWEAQEPVDKRESKPNPPKKISAQPQKNPFKKKRSDQVLFNFQDLFAVHKSLKRTKKHGGFKSKFQRRGNKELLSGNYLDSSKPVRNRGKHREIKKKKLTKLKLAIIKERIIKQKFKENSMPEYSTGNECFQVIEKIDFKSEIKTYLEKLSEMKTQKSEATKNQSARNLKPGEGDEQTQEIKSVSKGVKQEENLENVVPEPKIKKIPQIMAGDKIKFTSKFREYCDNILTSDLNSSVGELIRELVKLQDRLHARDPIKAKAKRRHVSGIREAKKYLGLKKAKLIIIAPNLEKSQIEGGVYDSINELKSMAREQGVPCGFALDRYGLGRCTKKNVPVSIVTVLNYEGCEALFESTLQRLKEAKESFLEMTKENTKKLEDGEKEDVNSSLMSSLISVFREGLHLPEETVDSESR